MLFEYFEPFYLELRFTVKCLESALIKKNLHALCHILKWKALNLQFLVTKSKK